MKKLDYIGIDDWDCPVYKDDTGKLWKDLNLGDGELDLYSLTINDFDGEPDTPIKDEFEFISKFPETPTRDERSRYQMLCRLQSDCDYYLGFGNRCTNRLWAGNEKKQITEMKRLWHSFSDTGKPEWLTLEQINEYEKQLCLCGGNEDE